MGTIFNVTITFDQLHKGYRVQPVYCPIDQKGNIYVLDKKVNVFDIAITFDHCYQCFTDLMDINGFNIINVVFFVSYTKTYNIHLVNLA